MHDSDSKKKGGDRPHTYPQHTQPHPKPQPNPQPPYKEQTPNSPN